MKKKTLVLMVAALIVMTAHAQKTVYIPESWSYNATTEEYTENGNSELQWSFKRSKETDNCIIFWLKGFGSDPSKAPSLNGTSMTFDVDAVLKVAETCYDLNVNKLGL